MSALPAMLLAAGAGPRWASMVAAGLLGLGLAIWLGSPPQDEVTAAELAVAALQARLQSVSAGAAALPLVPMPDAPAPDETAALWSWLQQGLQTHGLQVLALQPQAMASPHGLAEQTLRLRLQGRWVDWQAWLQALHRHAPWWVMDQWLVLPAGVGVQTVRIELQARLALWPAAWPRPQPQGAARVWPDWPAQPAPEMPVWFEPRTAQSTGSTGPAGPVPVRPEAGLSDDPRQWPIERLRLLGVWREGARRHAVLGQGLQAVVVRPGQRVGPQGHRVGAVGESEVSLYPADANGPVLRLALPEARP